jgi:hypothetical protein
MELENINHIHVVTKDFEKYKETMEFLFGREPNFFHDYTPEAGCVVAFWNLPIGFQVMGLTDLEKVQVYSDWLPDAEPGIHTLSCQVRNIDDCMKEMEANGWSFMHDGGYAEGQVRECVFDTFDTFGFYIELMEYVADQR